MGAAGARRAGQMGAFAFDEERVALPTGAFARVRRRMLRLDGRTVLGVTAGAFRPYLFPVYTPQGFAVTAEAPADHPHHHSVWVGADHVHLAMPAMDGRPEIYAYNCYVNDTFQGRAPGRVVETAAHGAADGDAFVLTQTIEWRGPLEWGAPMGRLLLRESRATRIVRTDSAYVLDQRCDLTAQEFDIAIGPTRHAWFNYRIAPSMSVESGGELFDERGAPGPAELIDPHARWVAANGPVGGGHRAGIALAPRATPAGDQRWWWFVSDWGVATASPCRERAIELARGAHTTLEARYVVYDGVLAPRRVAELIEDV